MNKPLLSIVILTVATMSLAAQPAAADKLLFEIGKADNNTAEFALGPNRSSQYSTSFPRDALYIVGQSNPKEDFPYIQPGPADTWAGSKAHTIAILFGLKSTPAQGSCTLHLDFVDTHSTKPPRLHIHINDAVFDVDLPRGAGDASAFGEVEKGREHISEVKFDAALLRTGTNRIAIENSTGSWVLYDYLSLRTPDGVEQGPLDQTNELLGVESQPFLVKRQGKLYQPVEVSVLHIGEPVEAKVSVGGGQPVVHKLQSGYKTVEGLAPAVDKPTKVDVTITAAGKPLGTRSVEITPVRKWEVYILHHSHVDIGYTNVQTDVLKKHFGYFEKAIELASKSADYPPGSQFKWNSEVLWAVDGYLRQATPEKRDAFINAVKKGWIELDALYGNELTALCRPEELVRLVDCAKKLRSKYGVKINAAMITDVPGYTWGIVPVLAQSGVPYFSIGPNRGHRIGFTLSQWGDKPFYWKSPSGENKVLTWVAGEGYSLFHSGRLNSGTIFEYLKRLEKSHYPYDMLQIRYSIGGDNGPPDPELADYVRSWNEKYAYPKIIISTTSQMCAAFERRYGDKLPTYSGDFTPYWEDGAGSSARETTINRASADRLTQAEAMYAMFEPDKYPAEKFYQAWRNVVLYDEHTWGAHNSISEPESDFALSQWKIKQAFALDGHTQSRELLARSIPSQADTAAKISAFDVINTTSWPRTEVVALPKSWKVTGSVVCDSRGKTLPTIRTGDGGLEFVARNIPAFAASRFELKPADSPEMRAAMPVANGATLKCGPIELTVDQTTGAIASLKYEGIGVDLAGGNKAMGLNEYLYVEGRDPKSPKHNGPVRITSKTDGFSASLVIECDAPGTRKLTREIRLTAGSDRIDIIDTIDKENIYKPEAVHIAFPFNVPGGVVRMDTPFAVVRPELDQLAGACKNYFTVQRYVDISNRDYGVLWLTPDAPLIEIGSITTDARTIGWIEKLKPSTTIYSYVMNNYWETNYKASQSGPTTFRYSIIPYKSSRMQAGRKEQIATGISQPLIVMPVSDKSSPRLKSLVSVKPQQVVATILKPSADGKALILRLYNPTDRTRDVTLDWADPAPVKVSLTEMTEVAGKPMPKSIKMAPKEIVTVRATLPAFGK